MKINFPLAAITSTILAVSLGLTSHVTGQEKNESSQSADHDGDGQWLQLFNGKDMTGWTPKIRGAEFGENWKIMEYLHAWDTARERFLKT